MCPSTAEAGYMYNDATVTDDDRARWLRQVPHTRAGRRCDCGTCPSFELTDPAGVTPDMRNSRVVLEASTTGALLLLFIDDDRLSYLELAPLDNDTTFQQFPDAQGLALAHRRRASFWSSARSSAEDRIAAPTLPGWLGLVARGPPSQRRRAPSGFRARMHRARAQTNRTSPRRRTA
jgi:hypothetical protein